MNKLLAKLKQSLASIYGEPNLEMSFMVPDDNGIKSMGFPASEQYKESIKQQLKQVRAFQMECGTPRGRFKGKVVQHDDPKSPVQHIVHK